MTTTDHPLELTRDRPSSRNLRQARGGVLVLGGGFAGASVARALGRAGATVVNPTTFMLYTPILPEAASGTLEPRRAAVGIRAMCPHAELLVGRVGLIADRRAEQDRSAWPLEPIEADRAFTAASRARRGAALLGRVRRPGRAICGLPVYTKRSTGAPVRAALPISLEAIAGTTEPNRAAQFDHHFRPKPLTRGRWQRVWIAVQQGVTLPRRGRADRRRLRDPRRPPPRVGGQGARRADDHRAGGLVTTI